MNRTLNVQKLKEFIKYYKLKISGNKNELLTRLFNYLYLSSHIIKIQKLFRGHLQRLCNKYRGPAFMKRNKCTNNSDFLTMEDIKDMDYCQFFSYKGSDGFIYGFDLLSLYNLISKSDKDVRNPYNREIITNNVIEDVNSLIRISKKLKNEINIIIPNITTSNQKGFELKILDVFQTINYLGNYSDPAWFLSLNRGQYIKFIRELFDIWNYRAQLSNEIKRKICHGKK